MSLVVKKTGDENQAENNEARHTPGPESFRGKKGMGEVGPAYLSGGTGMGTRDPRPGDN